MKGFPKQIKYIVGNEACERFSYYGMRSILVVFMTTQLAFADKNAVFVNHLFVSGCYLLPLLGAFLSDRFLGKYRTILFLSLFYCFGHLTLSLWENPIGLYVGLALIALGSGGIKPCVAAYVGDQFTAKDQHLIARVFDYFYFSINFGSFFSTLLIPVTLKYLGSRIAFGIPGILMGLATLVFWLGRKQYVNVPPTRGQTGKAGFMPVFLYSLTHLGDRAKAGSFWDIARSRYTAEEVEGAQAAAAVFKVFITVSVFWSLFDQSTSSWVLQGEKMYPVFLGMHVEASQMQAVNPILVMILIPLFAVGIYPAFDRIGLKPTPLRRMSVGMLLAAFSFAAVAIIQHLLLSGVQVNIMWQAVPYLILTASEIMVSITGLEFAYTQAPRYMKSTIMSFWNLTVFAGNLLTAIVAELNTFDIGSPHYFWFYAGLMLAVACVFVFGAARYRERSFLESGALGVATA